MIIVGVVLIAVVVLLLVKVPIAFAFGLGSLALIAAFGMKLGWVAPTGLSIITAFPMLAIPLFIFLGLLMESTGLARRLLDVVNVLVGRIRGGLGIVVVVGCGVFGAISGSAASAIVAVGAILLPRMEDEGYPKDYSIALILCSAMLALFIPPSMDMILFGFMGDISIAACFLATVGPGLVIIVLYSIINLWITRRFPIKVLPPVGIGTLMKELGHATKRALLILLVPVIIFGGIYGGVFTPTEAAGVSCIVALAAASIYRAITVRGLGGTMMNTISMVGTIMTVVFFMLIVGRVLIWQNIITELIELLGGISGRLAVQLLTIDLLLILIGMIIDDTSASILGGILLLPVAEALGVNPYHFAGIVMAGLGLGLLTPPVAPLVYLGSAIAGGMPLPQFFRYCAPFMLLANLPVLLLATYIPEISTFLPNLVLGTGLGHLSFW